MKKIKTNNRPLVVVILAWTFAFIVLVVFFIKAKNLFNF
ncbi:hypothetical protein FLB_08920 [Flavobacterium succinicans]|uniref:Uncharacterized protein n=1 Tax=Flavobacterium succinicans TaxID=29536 RepID=A0A199XUX6_9FLAO|nr:hypothetical protein FLB_08920 [Flavobacterium succinicans]